MPNARGNWLDAGGYNTGSDPLAIGARVDNKKGRSCWLRFASQQYTLSCSATISYYCSGTRAPPNPSNRAGPTKGFQSAV